MLNPCIQTNLHSSSSTLCFLHHLTYQSAGLISSQSCSLDHSLPSQPTPKHSSLPHPPLSARPWCDLESVASLQSNFEPVFVPPLPILTSSAMESPRRPCNRCRSCSHCLLLSRLRPLVATPPSSLLCWTFFLRRNWALSQPLAGPLRSRPTRPTLPDTRQATL